MNRIGLAEYKAAVVPADTPERGFDLREILSILWSARFEVLICCLLGAAIAFGVVKQITPQYQSSASIMLDLRQTRIIDLESVLTEAPLSRQVIEGELLVIQSDTLLERVVDKLRLDLDPEFNPALARPSEMSLLIGEKVAALKAALGIAAEEPAPAVTAPELPPSPDVLAAEARSRAVRALRGRLTAKQLSPAYAISVQIRSTDPVKAALIANTVADQYVLDQIEAKYDAARRATSWLTGRLEELRTRVEASEKAVQVYTSTYRTGDSQAATITTQQIAQLNSELINAQAEVARAEARSAQAKEMVAALGPAGAATSLSSPLIVSLRSQRADLARREAELSNRYGPRHPAMVDLRNQMRDVDSAIAIEVRQIVTSVENDAQVARARLNALQEGLAGLEQQASGQSEAAVGLRQLQAEAEANRRIYNDFLQRLNETREQEGSQSADSRVIEPATPAYGPVLPKTKPTVALGGVAGAALGLGLVILRRLLTRTFQTAAALTAQTGLPVLASIPTVRRRYMRRVLSYLRRRPNSDLAESSRYLRNAMVVGAGAPIRSALITSSFPAEGKTTLSILLAEMLARMGKSVVLIDGDMRRPRIAAALGLEVEHDLMHILAGVVAAEDAIVTPEDGSFDLIALNAAQGESADLLASDRMQRLIETLEKSFDVVLIDGPPVLGVGDFSVFGRLVDATIVAVQWDRTPVSALERTLRALADSRMPVLGAVLTRVNRRRAAQYDPETYGAEYATFKRYYKN